MSLVLRLPREMPLCRSSSNVTLLPMFLKLLQNAHFLLTFDTVHNPLSCHAKRHWNVQKWSEHDMLFNILTSKCFSRHNGVQFFISHLARWLCTRRFSEPTFRPSGATNHWKNTAFRGFPTFLRTWIVFLLRLYLFDVLSSSLLFSSFLSSLTLTTSAFPSVHIVGSLTSKLPSVTGYDYC